MFGKDDDDAFFGGTSKTKKIYYDTLCRLFKAYTLRFLPRPIRLHVSTTLCRFHKSRSKV